MKERKFSPTLFSIYQGTSDDLILWFSISTIFLTVNKGMSAAQIMMMESIGYWVMLALAYPCYVATRKIGNGKSVLLAAILFLCAALILTFGKGFWILTVGICVYGTAGKFQGMAQTLLENACRERGQDDLFVQIMSKAEIIYSAVTFLCISFYSYLYNIHNYLPMYICIGFCVSSLILAYIVSQYDNGMRQMEIKQILPGRSIPHFDKTTVATIFIFALQLSIYAIGYGNMALLFQEKLEQQFDVAQVVQYFTYFSMIIRFGRIAGGFVCNRLGKRMRFSANTVIVLSIIILLAPILAYSSRWMDSVQGAIIITVALCCIVMTYDSFNIFVSHFMLKRLPTERSQLARHTTDIISTLIQGLLCSIISVVLNFKTQYEVMLVFTVLAAVLLLLCVLTRNVMIRKKSDTSYLHWDKRKIQDNDSLSAAASVLLRHYGIVRGRGEDAAEVQSMRDIQEKYKQFVYEGEQPYTFEKLRALYREGHPSAIFAEGIRKDGSGAWLPVIFLDDDGGMVQNYYSDAIFTAQMQNITKICSFRIVQKRNLLDV